MRRLLLATVLAAAAFGVATPANAACVGGKIGVCYTLPHCVHGDCDPGSVDPYCIQNHIHTLHCEVIDSLVVDPEPVV